MERWKRLLKCLCRPVLILITIGLFNARVEAMEKPPQMTTAPSGVWGRVVKKRTISSKMPTTIAAQPGGIVYNPDTTPPTIIGIHPPQNGKLGVGQKITIRFSESVRLDTLNAGAKILGTVLLWSEEIPFLAEPLSQKLDYFELIPKKALKDGIIYKVAVGTTVTDLAGNALDQGKQWIFTSEDQQVGQVLAAGGAHGIHAASGSAFTWGDNTAGALGDGSTEPRIKPAQVGGLTNVAFVSTGSLRSFVLKEDKTVWAFGHNWSGELCDGTRNNNRTLPVPVLNLTDVRSISSFSDTAYFVKRDGSLWTCRPQSSMSATDFTVKPVKDASGSPVLTDEVAAGQFHALFLKDGFVTSWGYDFANFDFGDLFEYGPAPNSAHSQVPGMSDVKAVAAGALFSLTLKSDGTVWQWGVPPDTPFDELFNQSANLSVPVQVPGLTNVVAIAAGGGMGLGFDDHALALRSDGTVWAWGLNTYGQLGNGTKTSSKVPVAVSGLSDIVAIAAGYNQSLALGDDGSIWQWGVAVVGQKIHQIETVKGPQPYKETLIETHLAPVKILP